MSYQSVRAVNVCLLPSVCGGGVQREGRNFVINLIGLLSLQNVGYLLCGRICVHSGRLHFPWLNRY